MIPNLEELFSNRAKGIKASVIRELLKLTNRPGIISFAGGLPDPKLFPSKQIGEISGEVLDLYPKTALQYSATEGITLLREVLLKHMKRTSPCNIKLENLIITNGSQQALDLISKVLINPGDTIVTGAPTYLGGISAMRAYEARFKTTELDDLGMNPNALVKTLDELQENGIKPKLIYVIPSFQNPKGVSIPEERRKQIAEIAKERDLLILEDTPYSELSFSEREHQDIYCYAPDNTLHMGTFSKILAPGFRVGWLLGPKELINKVVLAKQAADLCTAAFPQYILYEYIKRGYLYKHIETIEQAYGKKRDVMIATMRNYFPKGVTWTEPTGGMFLWVTLPGGCDTVRMFDRALEKNVAYVIGKAFYAEDDGHNTMRLNFSHATLEEIEEGVKRLGVTIEEEMKISGCLE